MPAVFEVRREVISEEIDLLGHVNNLVYLRWILDAATSHSTHQGWSTDRHLEYGAGWVVRSHYIEYLQPAKIHDGILIRTWVAEMKRVTSLRKYLIVRETDGELLARAETNWAFVDFSSGILRKIPSEIANSFEIPPAE